jgi:hypothetical protein
MTQSAPFTFQTPDHLLSVTSESAGVQTIVRLYRDGDQVAEHRGFDSHVTLRAGDHTVVVKVGPFGGIRQALLLPPGTDPKDARRLGQEFAAPPGTLAARLQGWGARHPDLYAARHVVIMLGQGALGLIAFGAILLGLRPSIPWPALSTTALPLPQVTLSAWPETLVNALKYVSPIVIAIVIALRKARHRRQQRAHTNHHTPSLPGVDQATQVRA